mgnify:FL=1
MKNILIASAMLGVLIIVLVGADYLDQKRNEAMFLYDQCVQREAGMTAMQFRQQNGYKLDCK